MHKPAGEVVARAWQRHNRIVELIATGAPLHDVLEEIVLFLEEQLPGSLGSVLLLDGSGQHLGVAAGNRLPITYSRGVDGMSIGPNAGSCGTAAYRRQPVVVTDVANDPLWVDFRELALAHDLRSCWSIPILASDAPDAAGEPAVLGTFAVYRRTVAEPDATWFDVSKGAAHLAGVAIERVQALNALRESELRYRTLADRIDDALFVHDAEGSILDVNARACQSLGLTRETLLGRSPFDFDSEITEERLRDISVRLNRFETVMFESRHRRADGTTFPVEVRINPYRHGDSRRGIAVARDITERRKAEADLQETAARLQRAQGVAHIASWTFDVADRAMSSSGPMAELLGIVGETPDLMAVARRIHPDDATRVAAAWQATLAGAPFDLEHRMLLNGELRWLRTVATADQIVEGRAVRVTGLTQDVTAQRRLEEQVIQAHKMEAVGLLAGGIAHDFNNLLSVIAGHSDVLLNAISPEVPYRQNVAAIRDAGQRAARLTSQLLAFSRKAIVEPRLLDINDVVGAIADMLERLLGETIQLMLQLEPELAFVRIDPGQLEQLLMNLAVNAHDAMPHGGRLSIRTSNVELTADAAHEFPDCAPGRYVCMSVADTGAGMSSETKARIFEPFFTTKGPGKGTGLGLATVFGIVKQAGGGIAVDTEPGKGTQFRLVFPAVNETLESNTAIDSPAVSPGAAAPDTLGRRPLQTVLLAGESDDVRQLMKLLLESDGYIVLDAGSGSEIVEAAQQQSHIDLLISDLAMPDMSSSELERRVRARHPEVRVLYVSGTPAGESLRRGAGQSEVPLLRKPFSRQSLVASVRAALGR